MDEWISVGQPSHDATSIGQCPVCHLDVHIPGERALIMRRRAEFRQGHQAECQEEWTQLRNKIGEQLRLEGRLG